MTRAIMSARRLTQLGLGTGILALVGSSLGCSEADPALDGMPVGPAIEDAGWVPEPGPDCFSNDDCDDGHECVLDSFATDDAGASDEGDASANQAPGYCSDECDNDLCVGRTECGSNDVCAELEYDCSERFPTCPESTKYCDLSDGRCYANNGVCKSPSDCPIVGAALGVAADCQQSRCALVTPEPEPFGPNGIAISLMPVRPERSSGAPQPMIFETSEQIQFEYVTRHAHFLLVRTERPGTATTDFTAEAIWGVARRAASGPGTRRTARWSDGHRIEDGVWHDDPGDPIAGVTLYALVIAVDGDNVVDTSQVLAFRVGSPFPRPGSACTRSLNINDRRRGEPLAEECFHPSIAMTCVNAACREICVGSHGCASPDKCSVVPEVGIRVCTPPPR
jgi:hypothetical protein